MKKQMTGAELASMLKSNIHFKSLGGVQVPGLKLSEAELKTWRERRIGMFIHWGLYSLLGRGEWVCHNEQIPLAEYRALMDRFTAERFDADDWAETAAAGGMRYTVMVTRHHDGFALWDSPGSWQQFDAMHSAAHRDFVREYTDAVRARGLACGLYYSPMDWRIPGYFHPKEMPESAQELKQQCWDQVEELMTRYGKIDILWYDGGWLAHKGGDVDGAWLWDSGNLNTMVRRHQGRTIAINPRSGWEGDFCCDEGSHAICGKIIPVPWEKNLCINSGTSWGYVPDDPPRPLEWIVRMTVDALVRDGNILWNVSPDGTGRIPQAQKDRLKELGDWLSPRAEAIYGTRGGPFQPVDGVYGATFAENRIYIHVLDTEAFRREVLPPLDAVITSARRLVTGEAVPFTQSSSGITLSPSAQNADPMDDILCLTLDRPAPPAEGMEIEFVRG